MDFECFRATAIYNGMLEIVTVQVTLLRQNARVICSADSHEAVVVDPGGDIEKILDVLSARKLQCGQIWLTHSHFDHCGGVAKLKAVTGARLYAHPSEKDLRAAVEDYSPMFGILPGELQNCPEPDSLLEGGEELRLGEYAFKTIHAPGHSPGSICYYSETGGIVFVGDVLFKGSIGRTDLPGGSQQQLFASIRRLMESLPPETKVLSGHGPDTTLIREQRRNPFLTGESV